MEVTGALYAGVAAGVLYDEVAVGLAAAAAGVLYDEAAVGLAAAAAAFA